MTQPNMILLYVNDPAASVKFYEAILQAKPIEQSPTFAMFKFNPSTMLGLWLRTGVKPEPSVTAGATEIGMHVADEAELRSVLAAWQGSGAKVLQQPERMDFGLTFTAQDPDGHRLRVFCD